MPTREMALVDLVVHELRTPLTVAIGSLRQVPAPADPVQQAAMARALRACERLEHFAAQMRDWTRLASSPPPVGAVGLPDVVRAAVGALTTDRDRPTEVVVDEVADVDVQAVPALLPGALASLVAAVVRASERDEPVVVSSLLAGDVATLVIRRGTTSANPSRGTFDAEWIGGQGFALPLASAVVAAGGGSVTSAESRDRRLEAISVTLAVARPSSRR